MEHVIETSGLGKAYGQVEAVSGLDLEVPPHSIFGFLGPNGAGKTTTMKMLLGLARPTEGSGTIFGLDIVRDSVRVRERVGYLAQEPRFYDHMTARETLRFVLGLFDGASQTDVERRIGEALELVGLEGKGDRPVRGFSGGERQRLGIAQACIHDPDLLILDEPAASLDPMGRRDVLEILKRLQERSTVMYSTHILDDVERVSDRVAILRNGELVAQAPIEQLSLGDGAVRYEVVVSGVGADVRGELERKEWVQGIDATQVDGAMRWRVAVTDEEAAERELLRAVLEDPEARVHTFRRSSVALEDAFLELVKGEGSR